MRALGGSVLFLVEWVHRASKKGNKIVRAKQFLISPFLGLPFSVNASLLLFTRFALTLDVVLCVNDVMRYILQPQQ